MTEGVTIGGPKLTSEQIGMGPLNKTTIRPWKQILINAGVYFTRTVQVESQPPVKFSVRSNYKSIGRLRKKGLLRKHEITFELSLPDKPFLLIGKYDSGKGSVHARGTYELGKVVRNEKKQTVILVVSSTTQERNNHEPVITIKIKDARPFHWPYVYRRPVIMV